MFPPVLDNQSCGAEGKQATVESTVRPVGPIREVRQESDAQDVEGGHAEPEFRVYCLQPQACISGIRLLGNRSGLRWLVSDCAEQLSGARVEISAADQGTDDFILARRTSHTLFPMPPRFRIGFSNESDALRTLFDPCAR